jgi:hypothetical protein
MKYAIRMGSVVFIYVRVYTKFHKNRFRHLKVNRWVSQTQTAWRYFNFFFFSNEESKLKICLLCFLFPVAYLTLYAPKQTFFLLKTLKSIRSSPGMWVIFFIFDLVYDSVIFLDYIAFELRNMKKESFVAWFEVLPRHLPLSTEANNEEPQTA